MPPFSPAATVGVAAQVIHVRYWNALGIVTDRRASRHPFDIPVGRAAVVHDPFGNVLVLVDLSKGAYTVRGGDDQTGNTA